MADPTAPGADEASGPAVPAVPPPPPPPATYPPRSIPLDGGQCPFLRYAREKRSWLDLIKLSVYSMKLGRFRVWPFTTMYTINDPAEVRRVMDDRATFPKDRRVWALLRPLIGESIINSDGATWERQRRMIDPAFAQARLKIVFPLMQEAVAGMMGANSTSTPRPPTSPPT